MGSDVVARLRDLAASGQVDRAQVRQVVVDAADEIERLRACIQAEVSQHYKADDGVGKPYCGADDHLWPCPIRRRLEAVLTATEAASV